MNEAGQTVCLFMIVKNEQHVLRRCLYSVRPLIDHWVIVDTGSTDGTQDLACAVMQGIPGELIERPWKDFGHNRSESIACACGRADYLLTLDADEYLQFDPSFRWPQLTQDAYSFRVESGGTSYERIQLVRAGLPWRYEGVLHEYITCDRDATQVRMPGVHTVRLLEGARSRDPLTYRRDSAILEEALRHEPENARYVFYLAQSYRDGNEPERAIERYRQRATMGGFPEEVWCSLYQVARLLQSTGADWATVLRAYLRAVAYRPHRAEPLYQIGLFHQVRREYDLARLFFEKAMELPYPAADVLFVETDVYRFLLPLEYAVACYWLGMHREAIATTNSLLGMNSLSVQRRELLLRNLKLSTDCVREADSADGKPSDVLRSRGRG